MTAVQADLGLWLVLAVPGVAAAVLAALPAPRLGVLVNIAASFATLAGALLLLAHRPEAGPYLRVDDLNAFLLTLNALVGFTTSLYSASYVGHELGRGRLTPLHLRFYHAMYQVMAMAMNLAFLANNLGLLWVAVEAATIATVLMVGLYRTHAAIEAAWKYFILGSVGIALALFGTILFYFAAQQIMGEGLAAMAWDAMLARAAAFDPRLLDLAFVFVLVGYGTKAGLVPFHAWLPDAHAEGPTPISAVLSGLLLNVAIYAILRFKMLLDANGDTLAAGPLMMAMGLASVLFAALMLYRRNDVKRLFAYSSIEHMGIVAFAFGLGGPVANFAGLLHMAMHSLGKSAVFFAVGQAVQVKGTQRLDAIAGLGGTHPRLAVGLALAVLAIAGMPPFGVFMSEFLIVTATFAREPLLALPLVAGLLLAFGALAMRLHGMVFGDPSPGSSPGLSPGPNAGDTPVRISYLPLFTHLALIAVAGVWLPPSLAALFRTVAAMLG